MERNNSALCCIDFGTSTTAAAIVVDGSPKMVNYGHDSNFKTVACVTPTGDVHVCNQALNFRETYPEYFKQEFKLDIASPFEVNGKTYHDIVTAILRLVKGCAESRNNDRPVTDVVLTLPASYSDNDARREVMRRAAFAAGFTGVTFMSEPVAAAKHYAYVMGEALSGLTLVYDLGGGTFDPVLLECDPASHEPRIVGYDNGVVCGGQFFDRQIYKRISAHFAEQGHPLNRHKRLEDYNMCRELKEDLSFSQSASRVFSNAEAYTMTRSELESLLAPLVDLTVSSCSQLLRSAGKEWSHLDRVLLVGGSSALPLVSKALRNAAEMSGTSGPDIVRTLSGPRGEYSYLYAVCLGGVTDGINAAPRCPKCHTILKPLPHGVTRNFCSQCGTKLTN